MPAIYPVFEKSFAGADSFNGHSLSRCLSQLDELAATVNVTPLSLFIDSATMAHELLDDERVAAMAVPAVKWLQPADGLSTIRGIVAAAEQSSTRFVSRHGDDTEAVLADLRQLESLLVAAADDANRFHLLVDI